ncbi:MAG: cytochrome C [Rubrivivax sp.]|nr:cytochrome C [Rubrivivax sp.]
MAKCIEADLRGLAAALLVAAVAPAAAQTAGEPTRGALLYATHCVACHDTQMHWRDKRAVRDWDSLVAQVRLWQGTQLLQWSEADIHEVARHLNDSIYRLPPPGVRQGSIARARPPG